MARAIFDHWERDGVNIGSANPTTVGPVTSNIVIMAVYTMVRHTVTLDSSPRGVLYISPAGIAPFSVQVDDGQVMTIQVPSEIEVV